MIQTDYGVAGTSSGLPRCPTIPLIQQNQRIEGGGREAPCIMKYYISLILVVIIGIALYERPEKVPAQPIIKPQPEEPIGSQEPVGSKIQPPAGSF